MIIHSVSILSELKISSFGTYTGAKMHYQLYSVENIVTSWLVHVLLDKAVNGGI